MWCFLLQASESHVLSTWTRLCTPHASSATAAHVTAAVPRAPTAADTNHVTGVQTDCSETTNDAGKAPNGTAKGPGPQAADGSPATVNDEQTTRSHGPGQNERPDEHAGTEAQDERAHVVPEPAGRENDKKEQPGADASSAGQAEEDGRFDARQTRRCRLSSDRCSTEKHRLAANTEHTGTLFEDTRELV